MRRHQRHYARKRWGHGRILQLATRLWCLVRGHDMRAWHYDWPYDDPIGWAEVGQRDPRPGEELLWIRGCNRSCGCVEEARCALDNTDELPGRITGIAGNPVRQMKFGVGGRDVGSGPVGHRGRSHRRPGRRGH